MTEEPETAHVGGRVHGETAQRLHGGPIQLAHGADGRRDRVGRRQVPLDPGGNHSSAERLAEHQAVAGLGARFPVQSVRVGGTEGGEPELGLRIVDRMAARDRYPGLGTDPGGALENGSHDLLRKLAGRNGEDAERKQRSRAHGVQVGERVRRRDRPEVLRVVHQGGEEVDRRHQGDVLGQSIHGRVVPSPEPDQQPRIGPGRQVLQHRLQVRRTQLAGSAGAV